MLLVIIILGVAMLGVVTAGLVRDLARINREHIRNMNLIDGQYYYGVAELYKIVDKDPRIAESWKDSDPEALMHYYEMFKGVDFDKLHVQTRSVWDIYLEVLNKRLAEANTNLEKANNDAIGNFLEVTTR